MDVLLMAMMVLWIMRGHESQRSGFMAGLATGMTIISRPTFVVAGVIALFASWHGGLRGEPAASFGRRHARAGDCDAVDCPQLFAARPTHLYRRRNLEDVWKGNNPSASGSSYLSSGEDVFSSAPLDMRERLSHSSEVTANDIFAREIVGFINAEPDHFASLVAQKFLYFWWRSPQAGLLYPAMWLSLYDAYAALIWLFAALASVAIVESSSSGRSHVLRALAAIGLSLATIHASRLRRRTPPLDHRATVPAPDCARTGPGRYLGARLGRRTHPRVLRRNRARYVSARTTRNSPT